MSDLTGQTLGRYQVMEPLGKGGMAFVYKGYDERLNRYVALKVIRPSEDHSEEFLKRFEREAQAVAQLSHPNIVNVHDYGEQNGMPYLVMAYLGGGMLKDKMGKPMLYQEAARLLMPIGRALSYAHARKIVHRDIKPTNILLTESDSPMLTDFGIAKLLEESGKEELTKTGVGIGTPEYMAPEQGMGEVVDYRADIYSLGIVFYELITGRKPYQADTPMAVMLKHMTDPLPNPKKIIPSLPDSVVDVLCTAIAKKPQDRYQSMDEFVSALEGLLHGQAVSPDSLDFAETRLKQQPVGENAATVIEAVPFEEAGTVIKPPQAEPAARVSAPPPPPAKTKRSPWMFVALGIIGLIVLCGLGFGGLVLLGAITSGEATPTVPVAVVLPTQTSPPQVVLPTNTTAPLPTQTSAPASATVILQDDFSNPASGFEVYDDETGRVGYNDGFYYVISNQETMTMWGRANVFFDNVIIDVDAAQISAPVDNNNDYGVVCRLQDNGDGYYMLISGDGYYSILLGQGDEFVPLVDWNSSSLIMQGNAVNHLQVICDGSTLQLGVNGQYLTSIEDYTLSTGDIGFTATTYATEPTEIHFDNLIVSHP